MARVYDEDAIDSAYEFILEIRSIFGKTNVHSAEELKGLVVLMLFIDYVLKEGLAHIDWINWSEEAPYGELTSESSMSLLSKETLMGVIDQIEKQIPVLKGVFGELINFKSEALDEAVLKKVLLGFTNLKANWSNFPESTVFTEVVYELYANDTVKNTSRLHVQGHEISELMTRFVPYREGVRIYNPFSGLGEFLLNDKEDINYVGVEINQTAYNLSRLLLFVNKANNSTAYLGDVFAKDNHITGKFDEVICHPPLQLKPIEIITHCLDALNDQGKAVILLPRDFLNSTDEQGLALRKHLTDNNLIEWVITLPSNRLPYTGISTAILVLTKTRRESQGFGMIDLSVDSRLSDVFYHGIAKVSDSAKTETPWIVAPNIEEIAARHYNLIPALYLLERKREKALKTGYKLVKLKDIIKPTKIDDKYKYRSGNPIIRLAKEYDNSVVENDYTHEDYDYDWDDDKPRYYRLASKSLLMANNGTIPNATYYNSGYDEDDEELINALSKYLAYYDSHETYAFTFKTDKIKVDYLLAELRKDYVKQQWDCYLTGAGITVDGLLQIEIEVVESPEQQEKDVKAFGESLMEKRLEEHESIVKELKKRQQQDLFIKKHRIAPHLLNATSFVKILTKQMKKNSGLLKEQDVIDAEDDVTVGSCLQGLKDSLQEIADYIENLANEIKYYPAENLSIDTLLSELTTKTRKNKPFKIIYRNESHSVKKLQISFARKNFEELFNNILGNAERHGFTEKDKKYKVKVSLYYDESEKKVRVTFENNGNHFPEGAIERYHVRYESVGKTGNTGIGGWEITQIAENFGGQVTVSNLNPNSDSDYKVRIELALNTINKDNG